MEGTTSSWSSDTPVRGERSWFGAVEPVFSTTSPSVLSKSYNSKGQAGSLPSQPPRWGKGVEEGERVLGELDGETRERDGLVLFVGVRDARGLLPCAGEGEADKDEEGSGMRLARRQAPLT